MKLMSNPFGPVEIRLGEHDAAEFVFSSREEESGDDGSRASSESGGTGPRGLMLALLEDAIRCIVGRPINKREHPAVQARHAERWVRSEDWTYVFSFNNVCTALDIEPARLRRRLLDGSLDADSAPVRLHRVENRPRRRRRKRDEMEASSSEGAGEAGMDSRDRRTGSY